MAFINYSAREITLKIVYYGAALSGKTTNLKYIYGSVDRSNKGEMVSLNTETERTLFFDFLPIDIGEIQGFQLRFSLYTVPGQVIYKASRELVLKNVDGLVFVVDSQKDRFHDNVESLDDLKMNIEKQGKVLVKEIPLVFQYNKRDLENILPVDYLEQQLNPQGLLSLESIASGGKGVFNTLKTISKIVLDKIQ